MTECPQCGAPAEPGQLVCVECGARLALEQRRPDGRLPAIVALLAVIVLGAGAFGFALAEITDGDGDGDEVSAAGTADTAEQAEPAPEPPPETTPDTVGEATTGAPQEPTRSLLLEWPDGLTAHTVVLVTTSDGPAARRLARQAARSGIEAGLLRSDGYDLGTGLWIVFAGRFDSLTGAQRQAADLAERYPGAYAQLIRPVGG